MRIWLTFAVLASLGTVAVAAENPRVSLETTAGAIVLELYPEKAPESVRNFLQYVGEGSYNGTVFHRVIKGFMIQGGGFTQEMKEKPTRPPIRNEAGNGMKNTRGSVAMARTSVVDSATAQFYINLADNDFLNHRDQTPRGFGYAVFGKVVSGMEVVDAIGKVETGRVGGFADVPLQSVIIKTVKKLGP